MTQTTSMRVVIVLLRLSMAWVFLYAASNQVFSSDFTIAGFLSHTETFSWLFVPIANSFLAPVLTFLVAWGHLLIGLSLLAGLMIRASSIAGIALMLLYWMAHLDFPYVESQNYLLVDSHVVYALVLALMVAVRAGHIWGLDSWFGKQPQVQNSRLLKWAAG